MERRVRGVIIARVRGKKTEMPLSNIKEMLEAKILGVVPEDKHVDRALLKKNAVIHTKPNSKAARAYEKIAARILGKPEIKKSASRRFLDFLFN